jgi:hypothetical protein
MLSKWNEGQSEVQKSILNVSPNAYYPPNEGASARSFAVAMEFARLGMRSSYLSKGVYFSDVSSNQPLRTRSVSERSREYYALRSLLRRRHYAEVKHATGDWERFADQAVAGQRYGLVLAHFVYSIPWVLKTKGLDGPLIVDTHNSEWEWFDTYSNSSRNPLVKLICWISKRRAEELLRSIPPGSIMTHVSAHDSAAYERYRPDLRHLVLPNAIDLPARRRAPDYRIERKTLLFFGSLSGKMNTDALQFFAARFWPALRETCRMVVMGSHPIPEVVGLCRQSGWDLIPDVSEEKATQVFEETHFVVLPFEYAAGSKHKFLNGCARGVPVLSTAAGLYGQTAKPAFVFVSEDPMEWRNQVQGLKVIPDEWAGERDRFFAEHSWSHVVRTFLLQAFPPLAAELGLR